MEKKGFSTGCLVATLIGGFFVLAAVLLVVIFGFGYFTYTRQGVPTVNETPVTGSPASTPGGGGSGSKADPTLDQMRALEGGKTMQWSEQGMTWTVPATWSIQQQSKEMYSVKSPGSWDAGWITCHISPMSDSFPSDVSLNAMYQSALEKQKMGDYVMVRWLELDGVKGVQFAEKTPADPSDVQRVQWQAYRTYAGQKQLVNLMVHASGKGFPDHDDALYGILYSTTVSK